MTPPDDTAPDGDDEPELSREAWETMDDDEKHAHASANIARLRRRRATLAARGPEAEYLVGELDRRIAPLEFSLAEMERTRRQKDEILGAFLGASADLAESVSATYTRFNPLVQWLALAFPGDPKVAGIKKVFDGVAGQIPAELIQPTLTLAELEAELRRQGFFNPPPAEPAANG